MSIDTNLIYRGDCYTVLKRSFTEKSIDLVYVDPPFSFDPKYAKLWYDKETLEMFEEMTQGGVRHYVSWMSKRLEQAHRVLKDTGSIYLHCDWKFGHYLKVEMDNIFGRNNFRNEIVWSYSGGGIPKKDFPRKHDTIFRYVKDSNSDYTFNVQYRPYTEGTLQRGRTKVKGKNAILRPEGTPIQDWWVDIPKITSPTDKEKIGYPTQKSEALLERIIKVSSNPGDIVLDPMCGCGTTIAAAYKLGMQWIGIDISSQACGVMKERMESLEGIANVDVRGLPLTAKDLKKLEHFEFEDYICVMTNSIKTQHVADEGIDGYYLGEIPLQVKQQEGVGRNVVDNFETALRRKGKDKGYITAFSFTRNAHEEAARAKDDSLDITLVRVDELIRRDYELEALL